MSIDDLTVESFKNDTLVDSKRTQDDARFSATQKSDTVKDNILFKGTLRYGRIYYLNHALGF